MTVSNTIFWGKASPLGYHIQGIVAFQFLMRLLHLHPKTMLPLPKSLPFITRCQYHITLSFKKIKSKYSLIFYKGCLCHKMLHCHLSLPSDPKMGQKQLYSFSNVTIHLSSKFQVFICIWGKDMAKSQFLQFPGCQHHVHN